MRPTRTLYAFRVTQGVQVPEDWQVLVQKTEGGARLYVKKTSEKDSRGFNLYWSLGQRRVLDAADFVLLLKRHPYVVKEINACRPHEDLVQLLWAD